jgi:hypothetical protein
MLNTVDEKYWEKVARIKLKINTPVFPPVKQDIPCKTELV